MLTWLKVIRQKEDFTIKGLSQRTGLSAQRISALERGIKKPKVSEVILLGRALKVDPFKFVEIPKKKMG